MSTIGLNQAGILAAFSLGLNSQNSLEAKQRANSAAAPGFGDVYTAQRMRSDMSRIYADAEKYGSVPAGSYRGSAMAAAATAAQVYSVPAAAPVYAGDSGRVSAAISAYGVAQNAVASQTADVSASASVSLEKMLEEMYPGVIYHVFDAGSKSWLRNDYPHYLIYNKNADISKLENWKPEGAEPEYQNSPAIRALSGVPAGLTAVIIHPKVQQRIANDPAYAQEIFDRINAWFEFDGARNEAMMPGISMRSSRCVAIGEDGEICNAQSFSHGEITTSGDADSAPAVDWWELRLKRHRYYMDVAEQSMLKHAAEQSAEINAASLKHSALSHLYSLMRNPSFKSKLGKKIAGVETDAVYQSTLTHIAAGQTIAFPLLTT